MSFIDEVLNDEFFIHSASELSADERKILDESVREMLSGLDEIYDFLKLKTSDQKGRSEIADALEYLFTDEGQKKWRQDKN